MKEHPHAEFLRAIAYGESLDGWEYMAVPDGRWINMATGSVYWVIHAPDLFAVRRKQKMLSINGHEFPEPMRDEPKDGEKYWLANPSDVMAFKFVWSGDASDKRWLSLGLCHSTSEAAEAHCRAIILASGGTL